MENQPNTKLFSAVIVIVAVLLVGYILNNKYGNRSGYQDDSIGTDTRPTKSESKEVVIENTQVVGGKLSAPTGFPTDIPLEGDKVLESVTTSYPTRGAKQLSVSYQSTKTVAEKYAEYKSYMTKSGYDVTEGNINSVVRAIFGIKTDNNLSVAISSSDGKTLVQLAYLLKSI